MAEDQVEPRPINIRQWFPWTEIFTGFKVALDPKKLLLAAAGILCMAVWWWFLGWFFYSVREKPDWDNYNKIDATQPEQLKNAWATFKSDRHQWNLVHEAAGTTVVFDDAGDIAKVPEEYTAIRDQIESGKIKPRVKEHGKMRTLPWFEDRGENPYLLITGEGGRTAADGTARAVPWEKGQFLNWFGREQILVLIEPLVKFMQPAKYLLKGNIGFLNWLYFLLVLVGTVAIWGLFGGAITRIAAVQITRKERIGMSEAIRFTLARWVSFLCAPLIPLLIVAGFSLILIIFGLFHMIPALGDIVVDGIFWPIALGIGLCMTIIFIGLVGWPMMYATISTEGSDSFDALSRSYSYVFQSPWNYLWYSIIAVAYGMVLVFFVGLVGSMTVYLAKWGVGLNPLVHTVNRSPDYLFVYAPTSFGWRELLLQGNDAVAINGEVKPEYLESLRAYNKIGAGMVAGWLYLFFLLILGFGYSYFWSASTIIYMLMRRKVDDTDMNEVYLEEEELETPYAPMPADTAGMGERGAPTLTMVDPPTLKTTAPTEPPSSPPGGGHPPA